MKKHLSVFMLSVRRTVYKAVLLILLMVIIEALLFAFALDKAPTGEYYMHSGISMDSFLVTRRFAIIFVTTLVALASFLALSGCDSGTKQINTVMRLRISEKKAVIWETIAYFLELIVLWGAQLAFLAFLFEAYSRIYPDIYIGGMAKMVSSYEVNFIHSILPLADASRWIRNFIIFASLAFNAAGFSYANRRGKMNITAFCCLGILVSTFFGSKSSSGTDAFVVVLMVIFDAITVFKIGWEEKE